MDIRKDLESLCDIIAEQLKDIIRKIRNGGMSSGDLDTLDKLTHTMKSTKGVLKMLDEDDGYSGGAFRGSYRGGRRDSMGRYSRNDLADKMRELMADAPDDRTRQEIHRLVERMETA